MIQAPLLITFLVATGHEMDTTRVFLGAYCLLLYARRVGLVGGSNWGGHRSLLRDVAAAPGAYFCYRNARRRGSHEQKGKPESNLAMSPVPIRLIFMKGCRDEPASLGGMRVPGLGMRTLRSSA